LSSGEAEDIGCIRSGLGARDWPSGSEEHHEPSLDVIASLNLPPLEPESEPELVPRVL
jgi:hypothetical protein